MFEKNSSFSKYPDNLKVELKNEQNFLELFPVYRYNLIMFVSKILRKNSKFVWAILKTDFFEGKIMKKLNHNQSSLKPNLSIYHLKKS